MAPNPIKNMLLFVFLSVVVAQEQGWQSLWMGALEQVSLGSLDGIWTLSQSRSLVSINTRSGVYLYNDTLSEPLWLAERMGTCELSRF